MAPGHGPALRRPAVRLRSAASPAPPLAERSLASGTGFSYKMAAAHPDPPIPSSPTRESPSPEPSDLVGRRRGLGREFTAKESAGQGAGPRRTGRGYGNTPGAGLREEPMGNEERGLVEAGPEDRLRVGQG